MEDTLLMDAVERFVNGEMQPEEKIYFEDLRKNNPELDQAVVEQTFFLNQLENYSSTKNFKNILTEVEQKLINENFITKGEESSKKAIVIQLWQKYKRTIAVAASIAGIVSLSIATLISIFSSHKVNNITPLVEKISEQERKTRNIEKKLNQLTVDGIVAAKPKIDSRFRATGFMIDATNNYLVTNAHVVREAKNKLIIENAKGEQYNATAVYINNENDLAIVKVDDSTFTKLPALPYNIRKNGAELGEAIYMLGYPKQEIVYGEGYISAKNGYLMDTVYCQLSTAANEGNSGSPVLSKNGDLVGIVTSSETNANGVVYAIKSANIFRAVDEVKKMKNNENIKITATPSLKNLDRVTQVKKLQEYVFMIQGN